MITHQSEHPRWIPTNLINQLHDPQLNKSILLRRTWWRCLCHASTSSRFTWRIKRLYINQIIKWLCLRICPSSVRRLRSISQRRSIYHLLQRLRLQNERLRSLIYRYHGDKQDYVVTSTDVRTAMNNVFELVPKLQAHCCAVNLNQCLTKQELDVQNTSRNGSYCSLTAWTKWVLWWIQLHSTKMTRILAMTLKFNTNASRQVRLIMCSSLDDSCLGEPVMISYHSGMRCYQHSRHVVTSNDDNCIGGFYFTDGTPA